MSVPQRPNIVMIMADQLPAFSIGIYGHPLVQTPAMDRLAERGVLFENCYCNCPLCVPSRASMVTGRLVCRIDAFDNGSELPASVPTFMHYLRLAGYRVVISGKMHFIGPDQLHGAEERLTTDFYPTAFNWTPDWRRGVYPNPGTSVSQLKDNGLCDWNLQLDYDEEVHFRTLEKLRDLRRSRDDGRPFFLWISYTHPHDPFIITREYWDIYDHDEIDPPRAPAVSLEEMHPFNQWVQIHHEADQYPPSEEVIRTTRHAFYGMVTYFDRKVGEIMDELERLSLTENTIIMVLSDHGEMMGEHGMWFKRTFFDGATRVPLLMSWPGTWLERRREPRTVSLVDIFPTLLELADCPGHRQIQSGNILDRRSFLPLLRDPEADWKDEAICEYYGEGVIHAMRMLRRGSYKYVHVVDNPPLLFDMEADPDETRNLAGDPAYAQIEQEMRDRLLAGWDGPAMERAVMESQQTRLIIKKAMAKGRATSWDYQPVFDASKRYVREKDSQETNMLMRIPRVNSDQ